MSRIRLTAGMRLVVCMGIVTGLGAWRVCGSMPQDPAQGKRDAAWIERRIAEWQPSKEERAFEEIGWAGSLSMAESLAKKHGRAIFLFTYDGANLTGYRC